MKPVLALLCGLIFSINALASDVIRLEYGSVNGTWVVEYSCKNRGYEFFKYQTKPNTGDLPRYKPFHQETRLPEECRQFSTSSYRMPKDAPIKYDRGHGVHSNIWDSSTDLMRQTNMMSNITPQASKLNRSGLWRLTEELTQCYRDTGTLEVYGGVIWGTDSSNDHFIETHGVTTPDQLWKIIRFPDGEVNAWLMPNDNSPTRDNADSFLVAPSEIIGLVQRKVRMSKVQYFESDTVGRTKPKGCNLS